jgi:ABC transport system ATP-binding/permease protein
MGEHSLWISATDGRLRLHFETGSTDNLNPDPSVTLLLNTQAISKSYGATALFRNISLSINEGDRLGLIGPNGSGKSTFMEILAQRREPDAGEVVMRKGTRLAFLAQDSQFAPGETVRTVIQRALERAGVPDAERQGWEAETLGRTGFENFDAEAVALSGGWQKRLAIAEVLVQNPAILLLDEPTNHLDLAGIEWLEKLLQNAAFASVVISHDRYFLENVTTGMAELNRVYADGLFYVPGNYSAFLEKKAEYLQAQAKRQDALENRVRIEVEWLRRGPKARSTKAKARIDTAQEMIRELADIRSRSRTAAAGLDFAATDRKTKRLLHLEHVACGFAGRTLFDDLNLAITAGKRVGLVGANGSGKTTLLRLLRGEIAPLRGEIQRAEGLRIVYFDQNRQLDPNSTLRRSLAPDSDSVIYRERVIHVASWAARFLFTSEQLNQPVGRLSGGERARVLIANLMLEPADILLLDEPTNDLDIPTLEILEESLLEFPGALVLVTHDRYLLDRVSTMVLGLDGLGGAENFADYFQWQAWLAERKQKSSYRVAQETLVQEAVFRPASARKKLSYLDTREYETIEQRIGDAEQLLEAKRAALEDPEVMKDGRLLEQTYQEMEAARKAADALYARWAELEAKIG